MTIYRNLAIALALLVGITAAAASEWADYAAQERQAAREAQAPRASAVQTRLPATVLQAWALFPPQAATRGLPKEPRNR